MQLEEALGSNPFVIPKEKVEAILDTFQISREELLKQLIPIAKTFARPTISNYRVGVAALGQSGNIYLGVNLEFPNLPLTGTVHAEQFLIANARMHKETGIAAIALSAAPCGYCRQFLNEMDEKGNLQILMPDRLPTLLSSLLPDAFGPKDLGFTSHLLTQTEFFTPKEDQSVLENFAFEAFGSSYAPYSFSKSGIAIQTADGKVYAGSYLENAAFNPSMSPLQIALISLVADLGKYEEIVEVILVESDNGKISQESVTKSLLEQIAPRARFIHRFM